MTATLLGQAAKMRVTNKNVTSFNCFNHPKYGNNKARDAAYLAPIYAKECHLKPINAKKTIPRSQKSGIYTTPDAAADTVDAAAGGAAAADAAVDASSSRSN